MPQIQTSANLIPTNMPYSTIKI